MFKDAVKFPARSEMISRVIETVDHRILVVASDESHLRYNNVVLSGGLLEWTGTAFRPIVTTSNGWFITGYTPIDGNTAIVGTTAGFAREKNGKYATFSELKDPSYEQLLRRSAPLWLGRGGAPLGDNVWLFGCAGGVVAYKDGAWFYPTGSTGCYPKTTSSAASMAFGPSMPSPPIATGAFMLELIAAF